MKLKKIRDALLVMLTLALVSATAVAVTWALVEAKMGTLENTFSSPNTSIDLREDRWNGRGFSDDMTGDPEVKLPTANSSLPYSDSTPKASWSNSDFGYTKAQNYSTDMVIPKNPGIKNTTTLSLDESKPLKDADDGKVWVGMTVDYLLKLGTYNNTTSKVNYAVYTSQDVPTIAKYDTTASKWYYYLKDNATTPASDHIDFSQTEYWTDNIENVSIPKTTVYAPITAIPGTASDLIGSHGSIKTFNNSPYYSYSTRKDFEDSIATLKSDVAGGTAATYKNYTGDYADSGAEKYQEVNTDGTAGQWVSNNPDVDKVFYYTKRLAVNETETVDSDSAVKANISQPLFNSVKINHSFAQSDSNLTVATRDENNDIVRDTDGKVVTTSKKLYAIMLDDYSNDNDATDNDGTTLYFDGLPEFEIKMQGYAVQGQGVNWKDSNTFTAASEINNLIVAHDSSYLASGSAAANGKTVLSAATVS